MPCTRVRSNEVISRPRDIQPTPARKRYGFVWTEREGMQRLPRRHPRPRPLHPPRCRQQLLPLKTEIHLQCSDKAVGQVLAA